MVMKATSGFTLIELLVVIAIIALLMAILIPALSIAKQQAGSSACLMNEKQLVLAWLMYAEENDYLMCGPMTSNPGSPRFDWVGLPRDLASGATKTSNFTAQEEIRGIERGTLFPYYKQAKLVNCPTDKRSARAPTYPGYGGSGGYRTYSLPYHLNAQPGELTSRYGTAAAADRLVRITELKGASSTYIIVEENDNRDYNMDGWAFDPYQFILIDTIAVFHNNVTMFGYADGHSAKKTWDDPRTQQWSNEIRDGLRYPDMTGLSDPDNVDIRWLATHYPRKR
jgi:prepilin-type N-terminal cleavage/methylation domain-containing protein